ncbi:alcohol dehydrogenase catalytic domain-containing protein [Nocardiopsis sp. L17-MgMaSL7]|uniref:alcohol dehydrogenase catalytic domain-containing protein n=1 Tax=Nocardiopsis sp. L17-MgMaSL7 TaxID=1938893 RepID=UPI000D843C4E|nr:alcohol dehydrogenase catalytic domain-containing protein [Nocardiopsis sp. L17-MgMaSL7]PWV57230.1 D-arabinose 1-dehydrogenase-like Zn-dependent alcohol dehydrogenase [Nocardiopsis sp. L17-MgMaSL7]
MPKINAARLHVPGHPLQVETVDKPAPGPKEVLVKVAACGLVPNSYNVVNGHTPFTLPDLPAVFGLDAAGTVEAVGEHVLGIEVGEQVYVDPHMTCDTCHQCRKGRQDLCVHGCLRSYMATRSDGRLLNQNRTGGLSEYLLAPDARVARLPESIDLLTAARFGYIGTSFGALCKGELRPGQTLLINGVTGTLGVAAVAIALGMGATRILGVGRNRKLLARVQQMAPDRVETVSSEDGVDLAAWARGRTGGAGVDVLYDCLGVGGQGNSTNALLRGVKPGGCAVLAAGGVEGQISQSYAEVVARDVRVLASNWFTSGEIDQMIAMIAAGVIDLSFLEHRPFPLAQVNDAFELVGSRPGGFANVVVLPASLEAPVGV